MVFQQQQKFLDFIQAHINPKEEDELIEEMKNTSLETYLASHINDLGTIRSWVELDRVYHRLLKLFRKAWGLSEGETEKHLRNYPLWRNFLRNCIHTFDWPPHHRATFPFLTKFGFELYKEVEVTRHRFLWWFPYKAKEKRPKSQNEIH